MRLTVCLEGSTEGRVLASMDMEDIVKMTITDDIEKSNFNPQMLKACTDTSYECGYEKGRTDAITRDYNTILIYEDTIRSMLLNTSQENNLLEWVVLNGKLNAITHIKHLIYDLEHLKEQDND